MKQYDLAEGMRMYIARLREQGRYSSAKSYQDALNSFLRFCGQEVIPYTRIDREMLLRYQDYLRDRECSWNTVSTYMRRIRRVYGLAMENGEAPFSRYLFKGIFMGVKSKQKKALPTESLRLLMTAPLDDSGLRKTQRALCLMFLFCGMAFVDFAHLKKSDIRSGVLGSPDKSGGKFFNSIENLHLCTMNNQGLLALAQLILPSEILSNFEVVRVEEEASLIRIYLDESVKAEYKENPEIESKGFCEAVTIRDFPIRDKGVDLIVRRRKWYDKQNNRYFSDSYDLKAEETRYSKEFAAFLKGVYGDDSYDLPFA